MKESTAFWQCELMRHVSDKVSGSSKSSVLQKSLCKVVRKLLTEKQHEIR